MRQTVPPLDALFPRTRQQILGVVLIHSSKWWYISDLARHLETAPSSLQRELSQLTSAGILLSRKDGNRVYFKADTENPIYLELRRLFEKTTGLVDVLRQELLAKTAAQVTVAFVFGSAARGEEESTSDIDLLVIGDVTVEGIASELRNTEKKLGREIGLVVFTVKEFAEKLQTGNHFLNAIIAKDKLFVIGTQNDLDAATRGEQRADASSDNDRN